MLLHCNSTKICCGDTSATIWPSPDIGQNEAGLLAPHFRQKCDMAYVQCVHSRACCLSNNVVVYFAVHRPSNSPVKTISILTTTDAPDQMLHLSNP
ncbi:TPA: hypothetical protein ACH3X2_007601 [Trebouxia sp. C0005]